MSNKLLTKLLDQETNKKHQTYNNQYMQINVCFCEYLFVLLLLNSIFAISLVVPLMKCASRALCASRNQFLLSEFCMKLFCFSFLLVIWTFFLVVFWSFFIGFELVSSVDLIYLWYACLRAHRQYITWHSNFKI